MNERITAWLNTAVSGIRFSLDRAEVRAELQAHIEDKTSSLRRVFPDIPEEEARDRVLAGMGDAEEVKRELAKVHKPWLGRLWLASRFALGILAILAVMAICAYEPSKYMVSGHWNNYHQEFGVPDQPDPIQAELGGYTFQIIDAACLVDDAWGDTIQVIFRVSSPRFWERADPDAVSDALTVTAPDGTAFPMDGSIDWTGGEVHVSVSPARWGVFYRDFYVQLDTKYVGDWSPGGRVTLDFDFPLGSFALSTGVTERVVMK